MERELIKAYKDYYYNKMVEYQWNCCTAFQLTTNEIYASGRRVKKAQTVKQAKDFLHKKILNLCLCSNLHSTIEILPHFLKNFGAFICAEMPNLLLNQLQPC